MTRELMDAIPDAVLLDAGRRWAGGDGVFRVRPGLALAIGGDGSTPPVAGHDGVLSAVLNEGREPGGHGHLGLLLLDLGEALFQATQARLRSRHAGDAVLVTLPTVRLRLGEAGLLLDSARELVDVGTVAHRDIARAVELLTELHGGSSSLRGSAGDVLMLVSVLTQIRPSKEEKSAS